jgi:hypothetical protein
LQTTTAPSIGRTFDNRRQRGAAAAAAAAAAVESGVTAVTGGHRGAAARGREHTHLKLKRTSIIRKMQNQRTRFPRMGWPHVKVGLEMGGKAQERLEEPVEIRRISKVRSSLCKNEKL